MAIVSLASLNTAHASLVCNTPGICVSEGYTSLATMDYINQSVTLDKFDTSLGTLNSITLTFLATGTQDTSKHTQIQSSGWFQNEGGTSSTIAVKIDSTFGISSPTYATDFDGLSFEWLGNIISSTSIGAYSGTSYRASSPVPVASGWTPPTHGTDVRTWSAVTKTYVSPGDGSDAQSLSCGGGNCSKYEATGGQTFVLDGLSASALINATFSGTSDSGIDTKSAMVVDIQYNYTPGAAAPEPATMGLLGSALAGLAVMRKRLARKA